jgi:mannose-1-phosphate guanylyltransferase/mannose-6-phosphate isomerase
MKNANSVNNVKIGVAILAGGSGTRLWPLSNPALPKPFVPLGGMGTLYEEAVDRAFTLSPDVVIAVASEQILPFCEKRGVELLREPAARNTAPAVALAGAKLKELLGEDSLLIVLPADHTIPEFDKFKERFMTLVRLSTGMNGFGLMGITPTYPATGYGYIETGDAADGGFKVRSFREKPDKDTAQKMVDSGNFLWNSGMFALPVGLLEAELEIHAKGYFEAAESYIRTGEEESYKYLKAESIDYALMEKTKNVFVVKTDFRWSDVGNFQSLYDVLPKDENGNAFLGDPLVQNCKNCLVISDRTECLARNLEGMVVISNQAGVLATPIRSSEEIKKGVEQILFKNKRS